MTNTNLYHIIIIIKKEELIKLIFATEVLNILGILY